MEVLTNRFRFAKQSPLEKYTELAVRLVLLPLRVIYVWPLLKVLNVLGMLPFPHPVSYVKVAILVLALALMTIPLLIIFGLGLALAVLVFLVDFKLYRIETEEAGLPEPRSLPKGSVKHGFRKYLISRYIQSSLFTCDLCDVSSLEARYEEYLPQVLPKRGGVRPETLKGLPHRQFNQRPNQEWFKNAESAVFDNDMVDKRGVLSGVKSMLEGTGAKAARFEEGCAHQVSAFKGEFCHIHNVDGSWHCALSPADALKVVQYGWGEWWPGSRFNMNKYQGFVLLYGATSPIHLEMIREILQASYKFASNVPTLNGHHEHEDLESKQETTAPVQTSRDDVLLVPPKNNRGFEEAGGSAETTATDPDELFRALLETSYQESATVPDEAGNLATPSNPETDTITLEDIDQDNMVAREPEPEEKDMGVIDETEALKNELLGSPEVSGTLEVVVDRAKNLEAKDLNKKSDPYVVLRVDEDRDSQVQTKYIKKNLNPKWGEKFHFSITNALVQCLNMSVMDKDMMSKDDFIGSLSIPIRTVLEEGMFDEGKRVYKRSNWYQLESSQGTLKLKLQFMADAHM